MKFTGSAALALMVAVVFPHAALAQSTAEVSFRPGDYGTMVSGSITGKEYFDYHLAAGGGQEMFVELTVGEHTGNGTVYFNILPPGSAGEAIYNSSMDGNSTTVDLPADGTYTIRVYHMGNDEDSGQTSAYNVNLSIQ